jgi:hypothetical protein
MTTEKTQTAEELLAVAHGETQRLKMHFAQRSKAEKKRMTQLETLVPKLRNLVKNGTPLAGKLNKDEQALLTLLQTPEPE